LTVPSSRTAWSATPPPGLSPLTLFQVLVLAISGSQRIGGVFWPLYAQPVLKSARITHELVKCVTNTKERLFLTLIGPFDEPISTRISLVPSVCSAPLSAKMMALGPRNPSPKLPTAPSRASPSTVPPSVVPSSLVETFPPSACAFKFLCASCLAVPLEFPSLERPVPR